MILVNYCYLRQSH